MAEPYMMNTLNMDVSLFKKPDGNVMTTLAGTGNMTEGCNMYRMTLAKSGNLIDGHGILDGQTMTTMAVERSPSVPGRVRDMFMALGASRKEEKTKGSNVEDQMERKGKKKENEMEKEFLEGLEKDETCGEPKEVVGRKERKTKGSNMEDQMKRKGKKIEKKTEKKEILEVAEKDDICGEPKDVVDHSLSDIPLFKIGCTIMERADRIVEICRKSENLQGSINGELEECVEMIMGAATFTMIRSEAFGDSDLVRKHNLELVDQLREAEKKNALLEEQVRGMSCGPSSLPPCKRRAVKAVLVADSAQSNRMDGPVEGRKWRDLPLPPLPDSGMDPSLKDVTSTTLAMSGSETGWSLVGGRRKWRDSPLPPLPDFGTDSSKIRPPRPPLSTAVTITGRIEGFSYAAALRSARKHIDLETLGIKTTRIRKALNGGLLIEVSGEDSRKKAEELGKRLRGVLKDSATVSCPVKKRELRILGFDKSVLVEEIAEVISKFGGCPIADVRIGPIRTLNNGQGMVWAQLPVTAAANLVDIERIRLGWTMARVELLKTRPLQCFRCWKYGHVQNMCHSAVDRRDACFKCGQLGHMFSKCQNMAHCMACQDLGPKASHRLGGPHCVALVQHSTSLEKQRMLGVESGA